MKKRSSLWDDTVTAFRNTFDRRVVTPGSTTEILKRRTKFWWHVEPDTMAGLNKRQLKEGVGNIVTFIGITPMEAARIKVIFGDHVYVDSDKDGNSGGVVLAASGGSVNEKGEITHVTVVINRSAEVIEYLFAGDGREHKNEEWKSKYKAAGVLVDSQDDTGDIICYLKTAQEYVDWIIAEELNHTRVFLKVKNYEEFRAFEDRYMRFLQSKRRVRTHPYDVNINELGSSRVATRTLSWRVGGDPKRADYFRSLYRRSLATGRSVHPDISSINEQIFVRTGFSALELL